MENILKSLVDGKKVIVVGPSPHLMGKSLGQYIDSFDVVCRINNIPSEDVITDYGSRTDILFHNTGTVFLDYFKDKMEKDNRYKNIKLVYCPVVKAVGSDNIRSILMSGISPVANNFPSINIHSLPFQAIDTETYGKYYSAIGAEPNCGMMSIVLLSISEPSSLFITGFSFYAQGIHAEDSYVPGHRYIFKGYDSSLVGEASHPQQPQINFFKNFILKRYSDKITIDGYLNEVLSISHHSVLELG